MLDYPVRDHNLNNLKKIKFFIAYELLNCVMD